MNYFKYGKNYYKSSPYFRCFYQIPNWHISRKYYRLSANKIHLMKRVVIYSPDFSLCYSLMMYLQTHYKVIATTDIDIVSNLICNKSADLVIIDAEPDSQLISKCEKFKNCRSDIPIILTYVFTNKSKDSESQIKQIVDEIFYKPFDLNEITSKIPELLAHH